MKGGTLFSGGGGFCLGMKAAGVDHAWGVEYDDAIAQVARDNGLATITADILQCDPATFEPVDFLHASPPCPNFSNAKANAEETENDAALAAKVCEFIVELLPRIFTLENVYGYRKSKSWQAIARTLLDHGYQVNYWHVNMADYGVPQTRKRMIVIARRDGITPMLPPATHAETPVNGFFERKAQWVGWYEAIEDLIPTLPDSEFAPWQLERLPDGIFLRSRDSKMTTALSQHPSMGLTTQTDFYKAFIAPGGNANSFAIRNGDEPARVIGDVERGIGNSPRAFIAPIQGEASNGFTGEQPAQTIAANHGSNKYKAFVVTSNQQNSTIRQMTPKNAEQPSDTILATEYRRPSTVGQIKHRWEDEPVKTMTASDMLIRGYSNGRVVKMTPRALARFQAFPDSYALPESNTLACRIIGNAVPPLFAQRLVEWLI